MLPRALGTLISIVTLAAQTPVRQPRIVDGWTLKGPGQPRPKYTAEEYRVHVVKYLMTMPSPLPAGKAQMHRAGDQVSGDIMKVLGDRRPTPAEVATILDMVVMSFEHPGSILIHADRKPAATLFLLKHLDALELDQPVRERLRTVTAQMKALAERPAP